jgi:predicted PurR-regulated permease PerM
MPADEKQHFDFDRIFRLLITAGAIALLFLLLRYLSEVLIPFVIAFLLAYVLNPVVSRLQRRLKNRAAAVLLTVFAVGFLAFSAIAVLIPIVGSELAGLNDVARELRDEGSLLQQRIQKSIEEDTYGWVQFTIEKAKQFVTSDQFVAVLAQAAQRLAPGIQGLLSGVFGFLAAITGVIIVVLYVIFLLIDYGRLENHWHQLLPPNIREVTIGFVEDASDIMGRYFRGQFLVAAITGVLLAIGFSILGLRLAVLLGLFMGLLNMVPYLQLIGIIPAALLSVLHTLETPGAVMWQELLWLALVLAIVQLIQDGFLVPRMMGEVTGLRPAVILLSVFVWGKLLGFLGLVLAIPLTSLIIAYYYRYVLHRPVHVEPEESPQDG